MPPKQGVSAPDDQRIVVKLSVVEARRSAFDPSLKAIMGTRIGMISATRVVLRKFNRLLLVMAWRSVSRMRFANLQQRGSLGTPARAGRYLGTFSDGELANGYSVCVERQFRESESNGFGDQHFTRMDRKN
jgi:hypothetical protein